MKLTALTRKNKRGFTLIELLIVIALLGALAVGLLATIDPFEQLKKGRDTALRNSVSELYNALLRYYSNKADFPWAGTTFEGDTATTHKADIQKLIDTGELKTRFIELVGDANLDRMIVSSMARDNLTVCFMPESKGFQSDPSTIYDNKGDTANQDNCISKKGAATGTACYFCVQ